MIRCCIIKICITFLFPIFLFALPYKTVESTDKKTGQYNLTEFFEDGSVMISHCSKGMEKCWSKTTWKDGSTEVLDKDGNVIRNKKRKENFKKELRREEEEKQELAEYEYQNEVIKQEAIDRAFCSTANLVDLVSNTANGQGRGTNLQQTLCK